MKKLVIATVVSAVSVAACGGKVEVVQVSSGMGGAGTQGGNGGASPTASTSSSTSTSTRSTSASTNSSTSSVCAASGTGVGASTSAGDPGCGTCSQAIHDATVILCPPSQALYDAIVECLCDVGCPEECAEACMGGDGTPQCGDCVDGALHQPGGACVEQYTACAND